MSRNTRAFMEIARVADPERDPRERVGDYGEIFGVLPADELRLQGARCMDCGVPFCNSGCPLGNLIPDWNDLVRRGDWREAIEQLHATNNFPEFTGLICPAPCESACVLAIDDDPVMIKQIEYAIVHRAFEEGWIQPQEPARRSGQSVAVIGAGPAGMAAAAELNQVGHRVTVFERDEAVGGLMRFGVPDAKLEKWMIDRRVDLLEAEGVRFECGADVGGELGADELCAAHDAVVVAIGARAERDLEAPGRELAGVHFAMDYLYQRNRFVARSQGHHAPEPEQEITAAGKHVVVIGGGDTGMDCVSNANREGAASATLLDVYPELPAGGRYDDTPWPLAPKRSLTTYALDEGGERRFGHQVVSLEGDGTVRALRGRRVTGSSSSVLEPVAGSEFEVPADLVLIAIGFTGPERGGAVGALGLELGKRGTVADRIFATSREGVFVAGDARVGQSLIVTAIAEGRRGARAVERWLRGDAASNGA
ncbi:MAG: glutamate synthase small subunit [Solirubrobacterales bacterium]|nr:glutamate synthase small subunit [Solirubrobacterales bacterium]